MAAEQRPDPDELLARIREAEVESTRGRLTIFFGAAPGVGKTYTMLEAARSEVQDQKRDMAVGIVETHGRYDTASLLMGLEMLPRVAREHRGITLEELDLDAALARKPQLILVDELAHTNAPGSRHVKRWQDVVELLDAGIDVFTTLNVQHLESLNDVVAQITGVVVRETVPDAVFDKAYEVRVVDLPVDELLDRLREGKVYLPQQAARAIESFFREGNLIALRELALRRTAERVEAKMRGYRAAHGIEPAWHTGERILVCVSPSPHSAHLVRAARRLSTTLHADLVGVYVETPHALRMSEADRERLASHMRLVETLDGEAVTLRGDDAAEEMVAYARKRNVTKIVVGKPTHARWRDVLRPSFLDDVVRRSREIDVHVISGTPFDRESPAETEPTRPPPVPLAGMGAAVAVVAAASWLAWSVFGREQLPDVVMVYLLGIVLVSMRLGHAPALLAAVLSVVALDFFFVPPYLSFAVSDLRHIVTFVVMFVVAVVISQLTRRIREQADGARAREQRTAALYATSRELGLVHTTEGLCAVADRHLREVFGAPVAVLLPGPEGMLVPVSATVGAASMGDKELGVAEWAWLHQRPAGAGTDTLPSARAMFVPLKGSRGRVGVLAIQAGDDSRLRAPEDRHMLDAFAGLVGSALERVQLAAEARRARLRVETEQLRNSLLSSVSHDLRTPLAVVMGAATSLLDPHGPRDPRARHELLESVHTETLRLNRLLGNLLDMTRLEAGALKVQTELQSIEEVVGSALGRVEGLLVGREVRTDLPEDLPLVPFDPVLVEQVLVNLVENAAKYTPAGSPLELGARVDGEDLEVQVTDHGPGVPADAAERVFEKFYRAREGEGGGVGLGLTICRGIVLAHGGRIWVESTPGGGATFRFTLPLAKEARADAMPSRPAERL